MKSTLHEKFNQTSCKNCIFASYEDITQVSCTADRLKYFDLIEAYDLEKNFYVLKGFCNHYRSKNWNNGIADLDKAKGEISITFDLIIDCNKLNEEYYISLEKLIKNINYDHNKYKIILCNNSSCHKNVKNLAVNLWRLNKNNIKLSIYNNLDEYLNGYLLKSKSLYHIFLHNNQDIDCDLFKNINSKINDDAIKLLTASKNQIQCISNNIFKLMFKENTTFLYFDYIKYIIEKTKQSNLHVEL